MFNYELAKKLKDAGFPQGNTIVRHPDWDTIGRERKWVIIPAADFSPQEYPDEFQNNERVRKEMSEHSAYVPTLEELIEACGENIILWKCEEKYGGHWHAGNGVDKMRECKIVDASYFDVSSGKTPTEAVANLWLSLHTK